MGTMRTRVSSLKPLHLSRVVIAAAILGHYFSRLISPLVLPWGPAESQPWQERPHFPPIDFSNDLLTVKRGKLRKIYERIPDGKEPLLKGSETVVFGKDGTMYVMSETAKLVKLVDFEYQDDGISIFATSIEVLDLGIGRPLGGTFAPDGTLYIADLILGLVRVKHPEQTGAKVELVASRVMVDGHWSPINYADDVTVGKSGKVYFSDATDIVPDKINGKWDGLYASKIDLVRGGRRRGRLLEYNPVTNEVLVLVHNIHFANGVAVDEEEQFVLVSETFQGRTLKYYLQGPKKGTLESIATFPAFSDGVGCNSNTGLCYVALPTPPGPMRIVYKLPHPIDRYIRTLMMTLPRSLAPKPPSFGGVVEIDPGDAIKEQRIVRLLLDSKGEDVPFITGTTVHQDKLYLGFYKEDFIGVYDLI